VTRGTAAPRMALSRRQNGPDRGGDEFVCGLGGTDLAEAARRFDTIAAAIEDAQVGISVGMAALTADETPDQLTERADAAMLKVKARHRARA